MTNRGLSTSEASQLLVKFGPNAIDEDRRRSVVALIFSVLREPMLLLLLTGGVLSFLLADLTDAILLMATVVIVVGISLYQQQRTNKALAALRDLTAPMAHVIRDGVERRISSREVVP